MRWLLLFSLLALIGAGGESPPVPETVMVENYIYKNASAWFDANAERVPGPVAAWPLDDNAASTTVVGTFGLNGATAATNTEDMDVAGKVGTGLRIDATANNLITIADNAVFDSPTAISVAAWLQADDTPSGANEYAVGKYGATGNKREWALRYADGQDYPSIIFGKADGTEGAVVTASGVSLTVTDWNHVVFTYDAGTVRMFVNGAEVATTTTSGPIVTSLYQNDAGLSIGGVLGTASWDGNIDDVRFWNRVITPQEVREIYNAGAGTAGSAAWGGRLSTDASGNVYGWSTKIGAKDFYQLTSGYRPPFAAFKGKRCIDFDGTDDGLLSNIAGSDLVAAAAGTIFMVAETDSNITAQYYLWDSDSGWFLRQNATSTLGHYNNDGAADEALMGIASNVPYVIEAYHDGTNIGVGVNGQTPITAASGNFSFGGTIRIGNPGGANLNGRICEIITFSKYLDANQRGLIRRYLQNKWGLHTHTILKPTHHIRCEDNAASATVTDAYGGTAAIVGGPNTQDWDATGKLGKGFDLPALADEDDLEIQTGTQFQSVGWTKCGWFYLDDDAATVRFFSSTLATQTADRLGIQAGPVLAVFNTAWASSAIPVVKNEWNHICQSKTGANTYRVWRNGVGGNVTTTGNGADAGTSVTIGYNTKITTVYYGFTGIVDDIRFYDKVLTDAEVAWIYNNGTGRSESTY